jgi:hypothetical protein
MARAAVGGFEPIVFDSEIAEKFSLDSASFQLKPPGALPQPRRDVLQCLLDVASYTAQHAPIAV